jgi:hypothetical protein
LRASSNQQEQGSLTEESPEFGWFVDTLWDYPLLHAVISCIWQSLWTVYML